MSNKTMTTVLFFFTLALIAGLLIAAAFTGSKDCVSAAVVIAVFGIPLVVLLHMEFNE